MLKSGFMPAPVVLDPGPAQQGAMLIPPELVNATESQKKIAKLPPHIPEKGLGQILADLPKAPIHINVANNTGEIEIELGDKIYKTELRVNELSDSNPYDLAVTIKNDLEDLLSSDKLPEKTLEKFINGENIMHILHNKGKYSGLIMYLDSKKKTKKTKQNWLKSLWSDQITPQKIIHFYQERPVVTKLDRSSTESLAHGSSGGNNPVVGMFDKSPLKTEKGTILGNNTAELSVLKQKNQ